MFKLVLLSLFSCVAFAAYYENSANYFVKRINSQKTTWKAGHNPFFAGKSREDVKRLMGAWMGPEGLVGVPVKKHDPKSLVYLPSSFTAGKDKWSKCGSTIGFIKDQANCGSCWAVAASNVVGSRICIANYDSMPDSEEFLNEPKPTIDMSAEDITACCGYCGDGCGGGWPSQAMAYYAHTGVPTGGWYQSKCGCQPYLIGHHSSGQTPACQTSCRKGYSQKTVKSDRHKGTSHYMISGGEKGIMQEIYENGPVECAFSVYENFMHYSSGVYNKREGRLEGGHAITVIGWGEEDGTPYWLINNSWNVTWGDHGQVKFLRGSNLCGMEQQCVAADALKNDKGFKLQC